jgi:hypothetical protein
MTFKEKIYCQYQEVLNDKVRLLEQNLEALFQSAQNETKRTAGDKHETALAMLQIEQENMRRQLKEARLQQELLQKIDASVISSKITAGSLVKTNNGYLFISLALGKIVEDGITIMSVSPQSPLGSQLIGLVVAAEVTMNGRSYLVEEIS